MVNINGIKFGEGMPKICIPIVEVKEEDIIKEAMRISDATGDVVEWRIDFYEEVFDFSKVVSALKNLYNVIACKKLILVTFRTKAEGGQREIEKSKYKELLENIILSRKCHMIDIELAAGSEFFTEIVKLAHDNNVSVVASNHNFDKTPSSDEIVDKLLKMKDLGADISKMAVMPNCYEDVTELLNATATMKDKHPEVTVITMSMGKMGMISRIAGEVFGSAMTFGIIDKPSAPGQVQVDKLYKIMKEIEEL